MQRYPKTPGHRGIETSIAAAKALERKHPTQKQLVYDVIDATGLKGCIGDEVAEKLGWTKYEVRPRTSDLRREGRIVDSGKRRKSRKGIRSIVWVCSKAAIKPSEEKLAQTSEPSHKGEDDNASPPLPPSTGGTPSNLKGGSKLA